MNSKCIKAMVIIFIVLTTLNMNAQLKTIKENNAKVDLSKMRIDPNALILKKNRTAASNSIEDVDFSKVELPFENPVNSIRVLGRDLEGRPVAFEGKLDIKGRSNKDLTAQSYQYLELVKADLGIAAPDLEFREVERTNDDLGQIHIKFQQQYEGIPIYGKQLIAHATRGEVDYVNGNWVSTPELKVTTPSYSKEQSLSYITDAEGFNKSEPKFKLIVPETTSELVIYVDKNKVPHLAYHITGYPDHLHRWEYFIDARDKQMIHKYMNSCKLHNHDFKSTPTETNDAQINEEQPTSTHVESQVSTIMADGHVIMSGIDLFGVNRSLNCLEASGKRYMIDINRDMYIKTSKLPNDPDGTIWTLDALNTSPQNEATFNFDHVVTGQSNSWNNATAVSSQYNGSVAYDYFKNVHKRNSINGSGGNIISLVNVVDEDGKTMGNAFWSGAAMFYGNGDAAFLPLARGLDVAGHEMSHGVIQNTANLEYETESGALNESFADVFGTLIDRDDWLIGEDVVKKTAFPSGALRSLSNPHNGAGKDDYDSGFQPKLYSERYLGSKDNGGVHINSGIPNYAYYLFASNTAVGKDKAEAVYYRALSFYLTKSSQFVDCRFAVVKAATDLYGTSIAKIAEDAWTATGVVGTGIPVDPKDKYQTDLNQNPGKEYIMLSNGDGTNLYVLDVAASKYIFDPLTDTDPISRPSVTDDGDEVLFVGKDKKLHYIQMNYTSKTKKEEILIPEFSFRNAVGSRDGRLLALLTDETQPIIIVFDLGKTPLGSKIIQLRNPSTAEGISTGEVKFADAMEFSHTGEYIIYDALNSIKSQTSGEITYWDINFVKVFDNKTKSLTTDVNTKFSKLFSGLPESISVGNPTFSENSPYILALDYINSKTGEYQIWGANTETGKVDILAKTNAPGVPSYSINDKVVIYNNQTFLSGHNINGVNIDASKIKSTNTTGTKLIEDAKNAIWYANGVRVLSDVNSELLEDNGLTVLPNPVQDVLRINLNNIGTDLKYTVQIIDIAGKQVKATTLDVNSGAAHFTIDVAGINAGIYTLRLISNTGKQLNTKFSKL